MRFLEDGTVLRSDDGRYQIEKMFDHRGKLYHSWCTGLHEWEDCWRYLGQYTDVSDAKKACEVAEVKP